MGGRQNAKRQRLRNNANNNNNLTVNTATEATPQKISRADANLMLLSPDGKDLDLFTQAVEFRPRTERRPMHFVERFKLQGAAKMRQTLHPTGPPTDDIPTTNQVLQFTVKKKKNKANFLGLIGLGNPDEFSYEPSGLMVKYVNWTFRSPFYLVFSFFVIQFLFMVFMFALLYKWAGEANPDCIIVAGETFDYYNRGSTLYDGFALSWTTFTTVGYGSVYVATGNELENTGDGKCLFITLISTAESFIGLLFAGICTAIMFAKIGRIQSHAQVIFSEALCVEYGKLLEDNTNIQNQQPQNNIINSNTNNKKETVETDMGDSSHHTNMEDSHHTNIGGSSHDDDDDDEDYDDNSDDEPQSKKADTRRILCPVIKFQIVNQLANMGGGEILDANLNVMVRKEQESYPYEPIARFLRVNLEEPSHPFFNRVWHGRHVLNIDSPLVSVDAKRMIQNNGGYWPQELNSAQKVREHLRFSSLIITMTGISGISAESVQISKRYSRNDVAVGYSFSSLLYRDPSDTLRVDMSLTNDIREQTPNGGEQFNIDQSHIQPSIRKQSLNTTHH